VLTGAALAGGAAAAEAPAGLAIHAPSFRLIIAARPAAGYFTLVNTSAKARHLVGASSSGCGMLMLHQSMAMNGVEHMMGVKSVTVPPHGEVDFAPGGYHLMCMSPTSAMRPGSAVPVTLKFKNGSTMTTSFPVQGVRR
jgi:hypothetical protein